MADFLTRTATPAFGVVALCAGFAVPPALGGGAGADPLAVVRAAVARGERRIVVPAGRHRVSPSDGETACLRLKGLCDVEIDFGGAEPSARRCSPLKTAPTSRCGTCRLTTPSFPSLRGGSRRSAWMGNGRCGSLTAIRARQPRLRRKSRTPGRSSATTARRSCSRTPCASATASPSRRPARTPTASLAVSTGAATWATSPSSAAKSRDARPTLAR